MFVHCSYTIGRIATKLGLFLSYIYVSTGIEGSHSSAGFGDWGNQPLIRSEDAKGGMGDLNTPVWFLRVGYTAFPSKEIREKPRIP